MPVHPPSRSIVLTTVAAATLAIAILFFFVAHTKKPIRIGFAGGLTGRTSDLGVEACDAVQMATDEVNATGGIRGRTVELLIRDDGDSSGRGTDWLRRRRHHWSHYEFHE